MTTQTIAPGAQAIQFNDQVKKEQPKEEEPQVQAPAQDTVEQNYHQNKDDITIGQAFKCVAGAIVGTGIETVGNTAVSIWDILKPTPGNAVYRAGKTIWKTDVIGRNMKIGLTLLLPVAVAAAPVVTAIGSAVVGLGHGGYEGAKHGLKDAVMATAGDVKQFHKYSSEDMVNMMQEWEKPHLPEGQQPLDIKVKETAKGLGAAVAGGLIDGIGVTAHTWRKLHKITHRAYQAVHNSPQGPILKGTEYVLLPVPLALTIPAAPVGGVVYGVYKGFSDAYDKGFIQSVKNRFDDVSKYNKETNELLAKEWK